MKVLMIFIIRRFSVDKSFFNLETWSLGDKCFSY